jgi:hypothetical protein
MLTCNISSNQSITLDFFLKFIAQIRITSMSNKYDMLS